MLFSRSPQIDLPCSKPRNLGSFHGLVREIEEEGEMYKDRGVAGAKAEIGSLDRKRINDAMDKNYEKPSSSSASRGLNGKEKDRFVVPSSSAGKHPDPRDPRSSSLSKDKCSEG